MNDLVCVFCGKNFPFYQNKGRPIPRFCSHKCRLESGGTGAILVPRLKIENMTETQKMERLKKSFEKHVVKQDGCWGWKGPIAKGGYPVMSCSKEIGSDRGHRASWIIHNGLIPEGKFVCHSCDNPICTNPDHLWLGTIKDNSEDAKKKGRVCHGESRPLAKLKDVDIPEIRKMLVQGVTKAFLSRKYGVSFMCISLIAKGKTWRHVDGL